MDVSPGQFVDGVLGYLQTAALKAAVELDVFSEIAQGAATPEALAARTGAAPRGLRILCDYLTVRGFLEKRGGAYGLTPSTAAFLDRSSPAWMGSVVEFLAAPEMMSQFLGDPAGFVRNGGSPGLANLSPDNPVWVTFARAMVPFMAPTAEGLAAHLAQSPQPPRRVLDVAAGHGMFGLAIARAIPAAEITAVDWQAVLEVARDNARAMGVADRYRTLPGSAFDVEWGDGYDVVLLTNFLHHFDRDTCVDLLRRARESLAPGGRSLAVEFVADEDRVSPPFPGMFAFVMLGSTPRGDAYTAREFEDMGRAAGFARVGVEALPPSPQSLVSFEP